MKRFHVQTPAQFFEGFTLLQNRHFLICDCRDPLRDKSFSVQVLQISSLPWCSTQSWILPADESTWFLILAGLVWYFTSNLGNCLSCSSMLSFSGKTSLMNSSATSPSSSTLRRLAYHLKPYSKRYVEKIYEGSMKNNINRTAYTNLVNLLLVLLDELS